MGEAQILLRSEADIPRSETGQVERKLSTFELIWNDGFVRKAFIIVCLAAVWEAYGLLLDKRIEYYAGIFTGSPLRQAENIPGNHEWQLRLAVNPLGPTNPDEFPFTPEGGALPFRLSFSVEGYQGKIQEGIENFNANSGQLSVEPTGADTHVVCNVGAATITVSVRDRVKAEAGQTVPIAFDAHEVHCFDPESGASLRR